MTAQDQALHLTAFPLDGRHVLVVGATGLIGSAIVRLLLRHGAHVIGIARDTGRAAVAQPRAEWLQWDLQELTTPDSWRPHVAGVDLVVNASGLLQDAPGENIETVQYTAMAALFTACRDSGRPLVHISALGTETAGTRFMDTKRRADAFLQSLDFDWTILRPGLVIAQAAFGGSAMIRAVAAFPLVLPVAAGATPVQTVALDDIAFAVVQVLTATVPPRRVYDLVEPTSRSFREVLLAFRAKAGFPGTRTVAIPGWLARPLFGLGDLAALFGWRPPMRSTAYAEITKGVSGDPGPWADAGGGTLSPIEETLDRILPSVQERWFARMWLLKPLIVVSLALFWLVSGLLGLVCLEEATEVLTVRGMPLDLAAPVVIAGGFADILIGYGILLRRYARKALLASVAVSLAYLAGATLFAPDLWIDPLGPMIKVIPATVLSLVALAILEER